MFMSYSRNKFTLLQQNSVTRCFCWFPAAMLVPIRFWHQHGVSIQISINLGNTFLQISRIRNTDTSLTQISFHFPDCVAYAFVAFGSLTVHVLKLNSQTKSLPCTNQGEKIPGVVLQEFSAGDVPLGPWNPLPIPELVERNFAFLYTRRYSPSSPPPILEQLLG